MEWALKIGRFEELSTKKERNVNKIQAGLPKKYVMNNGDYSSMPSVLFKPSLSMANWAAIWLASFLL